MLANQLAYQGHVLAIFFSRKVKYVITTTVITITQKVITTTKSGSDGNDSQCW